MAHRKTGKKFALGQGPSFFGKIFKSGRIEQASARKALAEKSRKRKAKIRKK